MKDREHVAQPGGGDPSQTPVRVVKLGGSLIARSDWVSRFQHWWLGQSPSPTLLVVGGGPWADQVRELDRRAGLSDESAHWMAIRAMTLSAWTIRFWLPHAHWRERWSDVWSAQGQALRTEPLAWTPYAIVPSEDFLRTVEPQLPGVRLPVGWHVTSDSIAARIAQATRAFELVLLKTARSPSENLQTAADSGYVDRFFPTIAPQLPRVRWVDLTASDRCEGRWI